MNSCIDRLIACGYDPYEAASICMMLLKEGGDKNLYSYVAEAIAGARRAAVPIAALMRVVVDAMPAVIAWAGIRPRAILAPQRT